MNATYTLSIETMGDWVGDVATCTTCGAKMPGIDALDAGKMARRHARRHTTSEQQLEFASLNPKGQAFYDDARGEGADHETAFRDAKHSYGNAAMTYVWIARSGVRVVSSRPRDETGALRSFVATLGYYYFARGRKRGGSCGS